MHLYEEFKEYEEMWNESSPATTESLEELDAPCLDEGIIYDLGSKIIEAAVDLLLLVFKLIERILAGAAELAQMGASVVSSLITIAWSGVISIIRAGVFGVSLVEEAALLALSSVIQGVKVAIATAASAVFEGLNEDAETDARTRVLANFKFDELAQKDPDLKRDLQNLYSLVGSEQAQKLLLEIEIQIQQQAGPLAESLKDVRPEDLEANKDKIIKIAKKQFEKARRKLQKTSSQGKGNI